MSGQLFYNDIALRSAERVWPPRNEAQPNGEGVASGGATEILTKKSNK